MQSSQMSNYHTKTGQNGVGGGAPPLPIIAGLCILTYLATFRQRLVNVK